MTSRRRGLSCWCSSSERSEADNDRQRHTAPSLIGGPEKRGDEDDQSFYSLEDSIQRSMGVTIPRDESGGCRPSWSSTHFGIFNLRIGPGYSKYGRKAPSESPLYGPVGMDAFRSKRGIVGRVVPSLKFPEIPSYYDPACGLPALVLLMAQLPLEMPNLFGRGLPDFGISFGGYFIIKREAVEWGLQLAKLEESVAQKNDDPSIKHSAMLPPISSSIPPAVRQWSRLLKRGFSDKSLCLKAVAQIRDFDSHNIPMGSVFKKYNGKPGTITASATFLPGKVPYPHCEIDFDIRKWNLLARSAFPSLKDKLPDLTIDIGVVVEGTTDDELPERLLGAMAVHGLDWRRATDFD